MFIYIFELEKNSFIINCLSQSYCMRYSTFIEKLFHHNFPVVTFQPIPFREMLYIYLSMLRFWAVMDTTVLIYHDKA